MNDLSLEFSWDLVFSLCQQSLLGLQALHAWDPQIVHRDMKSDNILVTEDWRIKLTDFGLSRFNNEKNKETLGR